jgi:hypothetical protein
MFRNTCVAIAILGTALVGCGGDEQHEPLISGSVTGEFEGASFTIAEGVATTASDARVIALGTDAINCGSAEQDDPPNGYFAAISLPSFDVGTYSSVLVVVYENHGNFSGHGTTTGSVEITSSSAASVAGTVAFAYTDDETDELYGLDGTFEVVRCSE